MPYSCVMVTVSGRDEAVPRVLDDLSHGVEHQQLREPHRDHAQRVDDRRRVERRLQHDLPDVAQVAEAHVEGAQEERQRERERRQLHEEQRQPQDVRRRSGTRATIMNTTMTTMLSAEADERGDADGEHHHVAGEVDLAQQVGAADQRREPLRADLGEEAPDHDAEQQVHGVVRYLRAELEEPDEDHVQDGEDRQRLEQRPQVAEQRRLVAQLEVRAHHRPQDDRGVAEAIVQPRAEFHGVPSPR